MGKTIFIGARKGGVGKTMTAASLGMGLTFHGKRVLLIDADSQHSLTISLGVKEPDKLQFTLASVINHLINEEAFDPTARLISPHVALYLLPANSRMAGIELALAPLIDRELVLRQYIEMVKPFFDYIIIDTPPTLDLLTLKALAASDSVIIPVAPKYLDAKGLELLLKAVAQIRRRLNPALAIGGILLTMVDSRTKLTREVIASIEDAYSSNIRIFSANIPCSIRAAEASGRGISIFSYEPNGKVAAAYSAFVKEVLRCG